MTAVQTSTYDFDQANKTCVCRTTSDPSWKSHEVYSPQRYLGYICPSHWAEVTWRSYGTVTLDEARH